MTKRHHNLVDVAVQFKRETEKAILVNDGTEDIWLPKSQCELNSDGTVTMPEWLAKDKGLI